MKKNKSMDHETLSKKAPAKDNCANESVIHQQTEASALLLDTDGRILFANRAFTEHAGKKISEIVGRQIHELFPVKASSTH